MHKIWQILVAPVSNTLVDEMGHENNLGTPEVVASPERDPGENEYVVEDKVGGYVRGSSYDGRLLVEEVPHIAEL